MKVLVTGANGFLGRNLCAEIENIAAGRRKNHPLPSLPELLRFDLGNTPEQLKEFCAEADFVVHLAGVNRPKEVEEFDKGNRGFTDELISALENAGNNCPVLLSSSTQAALDNPYGRSKLSAEQAVTAHSERTGAPAFVYRFPNLFGKWCRPNYNSVVATFCYNTANGLPIRVDDESKLLTLGYVDDVVEEILSRIGGRGELPCELPVTHEIALGRLAGLIRSFPSVRENLRIPELSDPFVKKLWSTFLSYLPPEKAAVPCESRVDERGAFTELIRLDSAGMFSVNVCRPGYTKGNHWHHTKTERFIVVSGEGVIRQRRIGEREVTSIPVGAGAVASVDMLPGYTHSIENTGESDLVFVIWANEEFDPERPDTYFEKVIPED